MADAPPDRPDAAAGVFETLLVRSGRIQALVAHLARLAGSVRDLYGQELPAELHTVLPERAAALAGEHRLRVDVVPVRSALRWSVRTSPLDPRRPRVVRCAPVVVPGGIGRHKWSDRRLLDRLGAGGPVPLIVDRDGSVLEAAWASFWLLDGPRLVTPPADGRLLPGVTRARLLELAPSIGLRAAEEPISLVAAVHAPAILLTSSVQLAVRGTVDPGPDPDRAGRPPEAADPDPAGRSPSTIIEAIRAALAEAGDTGPRD